MNMPIDRIKQLQMFYDEDPGDPFNLYALALEYQKIHSEKATDLFEQLLDHHSDYLPTYYHAAKHFQESGHRDKAIFIYETGISLARKKSDHKTLRELQSAYDELTFE